MSQSLSKVNVHIVFSTKYIQNLISDAIRNKLHAYLIGIIANLGSFSHELYANPDHLHILCTLPRTLTSADLVSKIKSSSSKWLKLNGVNEFGWQDGYAIFSVSASKIETVKSYILNQPEHHKKVSFRDEVRLFLKEYGIEYDEKYVWD
ncbi:MAG: IS200/IS605 family transposase [Bacteroidales bacterium]|nr:IS200/IS605 family transposase [Bacteroidales bacterium]